MKSIPKPTMGPRTGSTAAPGTPIEGDAAKPVPAAPVVRQAGTPRQWNLKMVVGAVLVVIFGGLVLMYAIPAYSHRSGVLVTARKVVAGAHLQSGDLTVAQVSVGPDVASVPEERRDTVVGLIARSDLPVGTMLTTGLLAANDGFDAGQVLVPLALKPGQLPARGLTVGQKVTLISTPPNTVGTGTAAQTSASIDAYVAGVGATAASTGVTVVDMRIPQQSAEYLAKIAMSGTVVVVAHPMGE
jgi:SAF domain-containing protein